MGGQELVEHDTPPYADWGVVSGWFAVPRSGGAAQLSK